MRVVTRVAVGLVVYQVAAATVAWACSCEPLSAEDAVASGDAIVVGTITRVRAPLVGCGGDRAGRTRITIDVDEVVAGPGEVGDELVYTSRDDASCGLTVEEGERWVLQFDPGDKTATPCSASREVTGDDDAWLKALREAGQP